jgi:hypothetical protein
MNNLDYCTKKTKDSVKGILENPATRTLTIKTILTGLNKDSVDAVVDVSLALRALKAVMNDQPVVGD